MTFYLKYRPQKIEDLDITNVRESLKKITFSNEIPHALLFAGPKGTGKTSTARILAKIINCPNTKDGQPCGKCSVCEQIVSGNFVDVLELDGASNRGIDDIRTLRENVRLAPSEAKAKVYIIDEAHMLTTEASNALLKTLEEPPKHVYFILATTNPEKLIETIKSRTLLVSFTKATTEEMRKSLKRVIDGEKIEISEKNIEKIIKISKGSFRDGVKFLEQYSKDGGISLNKDNFDVDDFIANIERKNIKIVLSKISSAVEAGIPVQTIIEDTITILREELVNLSKRENIRYSFAKDNLIYLIELLFKASEDMKVSPIEELPLEIAVVKWIGDEKPIEPSEDDPEKEDEKEDLREEKTKVKVEPKKEVSIKSGKKIDVSKWEDFLKEVKPYNSAIEALIRSSDISYEESKIKISVYYKFHKDKLEEMKNKNFLVETANKIFQTKVDFECVLTEKPKEKEPVTISTEAQEIFG